MRLEKQDALVVLKPGEPLDPQALQKAVRKADFKPEEIRLRATGNIVEQKIGNSVELIFKLPDTGQMFLLVPPPIESGGRDVLAQLKDAAKSRGFTFTINGQIFESEDSGLQLMVETFEQTEKEKE